MVIRGVLHVAVDASDDFRASPSAPLSYINPRTALSLFDT